MQNLARKANDIPSFEGTRELLSSEIDAHCTSCVLYYMFLIGEIRASSPMVYAM